MTDKNQTPDNTPSPTLTDIFSEEVIAHLTPKQKKSLKQFIDKQKKIREMMKGLQENLDELRVTIKYLIFENEALRRERDEAVNESEKLRSLLHTYGIDPKTGEKNDPNGNEPGPD